VGEDEHLAHQVGILVVAWHEADDLTSGGALDDSFEAVAHDLLEGDALADHVVAVPAFDEGLLNPCELTAQQAHDEVVVDVDLRPLRAATVELGQQREIGDRVGCSQMHVSRIFRDAMTRLREAAHEANVVFD
jgi:hypothetical protein